MHFARIIAKNKFRKRGWAVRAINHLPNSRVEIWWTLGGFSFLKERPDAGDDLAGPIAVPDDALAARYHQARQVCLDRMHIGSVGDWDVFGSMVFWCACPGSIFISNNLVYPSAYPRGTLAFPVDIPRVYSAGYSYCDL
jgi:hypothetical protein